MIAAAVEWYEFVWWFFLLGLCAFLIYPATDKSERATLANSMFLLWAMAAGVCFIFGIVEIIGD